MNPKLKSFTDDQLKSELQKRKEEEKRIEEEHKISYNKLVYKHLNALLELTPKHSRTSCSDENVCNAGRCSRCTLLKYKEEGFEGYCSLDEIQVEVRINGRLD